MPWRNLFEPLTRSAVCINLGAMKAALFAVAILFSAMTSLATAADAPYRHVVFFKFKDTATPAEVQGIENAFIELAKKVNTVTAFEWGTNVSPEGLNDGFTHCFLVTFKDKAGLEVYLPHPEHSAFVAKLKPLLFDMASKAGGAG